VNHKKIIWVLGLLLLCAGTHASAQSFCPLEEPQFEPKTVSSLKQLKKLAVLHEGRVKPFDTFARNLLLQFSGKTSHNSQPAFHWAARLIFAPASTMDDKIFLINSPEIPMAIGIKPEKRRRYSFAQLNPGFAKIVALAKVADQIEEKNRSVVEHELIRIYRNVVYYTQFSLVFTFAHPHPDFQVMDSAMISQLNLPTDQRNQKTALGKYKGRY